MKNINFKNQDELIAIVLEINILLLNSHLYINRELQILFNNSKIYHNKKTKNML